MAKMSCVTLFKISLFIGLAALTLSGCATTTKLGAAASIARTYVSAGASTGTDWTQVLPPFAVAGSQAASTDMEIVRGYQSLHGSARWTQATNDASLNMFDVYKVALGPDFTLSKRPEIAALWAYAGRQFSVASNEAKSPFPRPRPFLADPSIKICTDHPPAGSSYPSGHAGWGWLSALILARVEPTYTSVILARGRDYGLSRAVCGVHYPSDLEAGRMVADAVLARLDNDGEYVRLLAAAKGAAR